MTSINVQSPNDEYGAVAGFRRIMSVTMVSWKGRKGPKERKMWCDSFGRFRPVFQLFPFNSTWFRAFGKYFFPSRRGAGLGMAQGCRDKLRRWIGFVRSVPLCVG